jgi:exopolysaccharide biosynthesis polyprenyl glycosylphosphotransferase
LHGPTRLSAESAWFLLDGLIAFFIASLSTMVHSGGRAHVLMLVPASGRGLYGYALSLLIAMLFGLCCGTMSRLSRLQSVNSHRTPQDELLLILGSISLAAFGLYGALHFCDFAVPTRRILSIQILLTSCMMFLGRVIWRHQRKNRSKHDIAHRNILIAGVDEIARETRDYLTSLSYSSYRFKGFVTLEDRLDDLGIVRNDEIVGSIDNVITLAQSMFVDEIIFSRRPATPNTLARVIDYARSAGVDIRLIPSFSEALNNRDDVQYLGDLPTIAIHQKRQRSVSLLTKRAFDLIFSSVGVVIILPALAAVAVAIKLQSSGPILYRGKRVGYKGNVFTCYKFRTMMENADAMRTQIAHLNERSEILFKVAKDPRVTGIGTVLRKYSLDELPQLWNVLRGDMSLVGPRPSISSEVAQYKIAHLRRLDVLPGITGLWQVEGRQNPSFENYIALDSKYVREWSIWLDLKILFRTVSAVLAGTGT